ncbi:surface antigen [Staphylococcus hominis]
MYTAGQCTWYVYDKVNGAIGSTWGNANNWANAAKAAGYTVNHHAKAGSILQTTAGSLGHVAYVESVNSDGSITISEMNYTGGAYVTDTRTISASEVSSYNYIHLS